MWVVECASDCTPRVCRVTPSPHPRYGVLLSVSNTFRPNDYTATTSPGDTNDVLIATTPAQVFTAAFTPTHFTEDAATFKVDWEVASGRGLPVLRYHVRTYLVSAPAARTWTFVVGVDDSHEGGSGPGVGGSGGVDGGGGRRRLPTAMVLSTNITIPFWSDTRCVLCCCCCCCCCRCCYWWWLCGYVVVHG